MSNYQLIFCTQKTIKFKTGGVHKYINFHSLKKYRVDDHKKSLGQLVFLNYKIFDNVNALYLDFFQKIMTVTDKIAPFKNKQVKVNIQKWFDGKVLEKLNSWEILFKKFKNSTLCIDKELFKKAKYEVLKLIATKKQAFFKGKNLRKYWWTKRVMLNI